MSKDTIFIIILPRMIEQQAFQKYNVKILLFQVRAEVMNVSQMPLCVCFLIKQNNYSFIYIKY